MRRRLSENQLRAMVAPRRSSFAPRDTSVAWRHLHEFLEAVDGVYAAVDSGASRAENDRDLSHEGITRRCTELAAQAVKELDNFKPLRTAEKSVDEACRVIDEHMDLPKPPSDLASIQLAAEIRAHIRGLKSPIDFIMSNLDNATILQAVMHSPPFLAAISDVEMNVVLSRAKNALHPDRVQMQRDLQAAKAEAQEAVKATRRAISERCDVTFGEKGEVRLGPKPVPTAVIAGRSSEVVLGVE